MAVSKRLRYEILRRDNFTCRYCGATATDTTITVDHVVPTALGGKNEPSNLVAACEPCNSGKSATPPDAPLIADVESDAVRWAAAMRYAAAIRALERDEELALLDRWIARWESFTGADGRPLRLISPGNGSRPILSTLKALLDAGLTQDDLDALVKVAATAHHVAEENRFRYYAGVCWREVGRRQEIARALLEADGV